MSFDSSVIASTSPAVSAGVAASVMRGASDFTTMGQPKIIIQGVTLKGRAFRPSDWAERLCGVMSTFERDQQMRYSPYVQPIMLDGVRCVLVHTELADVEPRAYRFLLDFAKDNELNLIDLSAPPEAEFCPVPGRALDEISAG
jgi:hypothetical protein